jgi:hypothetical protein
MSNKDYIIALDFDGTCVEHSYPFIGNDVGAEYWLKQFLNYPNVKLILWTIRSEKELFEAINWFGKRDIPLWGVNMNPDQLEWSSSPKCYANIYIDDAGVGCPLIQKGNDRGYVDWSKVGPLVIKQLKYRTVVR